MTGARMSDDMTEEERGVLQALEDLKQAREKREAALREEGRERQRINSEIDNNNK